MRNARTLRLAACLLSAALSSCAGWTPASTPPSLEKAAPAAIRDEAAEQKAADCAELAPPPIPPAALRLVGQLPAGPPPEAGEAAVAAWLETLTPEQRGVHAWFSQTVRTHARHRAYCGREG